MTNDFFNYGGISSLDYGMIMSDINIHASPKRDVSMHPLLGRNGDFIVDNSRWHNVNVSYSMVICKNFNMNLDRFKNDALSKVGYQKLVDSICPDVFRLGMLQDPVTVESFMRDKAGRIEVIFNCKPQRFLISGERMISLAVPNSLSNPTAFTAKPLIKVYGTGTGELHIGERTVKFKQPINQHVILDCEMFDAYRQVGSGAPENKNGTIFAPEFPVLVPGTNQISWSGDISKVEIIPRWWTI